MGWAPARTLLAAAIACMLLALPSLASAHLERPSYWPDPAPDASLSPPAGGEVPKARSLASALKKAKPGQTHVVCKGTAGKRSLKLLARSVERARTNGFRLRPSEPKRELTRKKANKLVRLNRKLARQCEFHSVQKAVFEAGNNDRVVIMPGRYKEKHSRKQPVNDPKCN